MEDKMKERTK